MENSNADLFSTEALSFDSTLESLFDVDSLFEDRNVCFQSPSELTMAAQGNVGSDIEMHGGGDDYVDLKTIQENRGNLSPKSQSDIDSGSAAETYGNDERSVDNSPLPFEKTDTDDITTGLFGETGAMSICKNKSANEGQGSDAKKVNNDTCNENDEKSLCRKDKSEESKSSVCPMSHIAGNTVDIQLPNVNFEKLKEMRRKKLAHKAPRPPSVKEQPQFLAQKKMKQQKAKESKKRKQEEKDSPVEPPSKLSKAEIGQNKPDKNLTDLNTEVKKVPMISNLETADTQEAGPSTVDVKISSDNIGKVETVDVARSDVESVGTDFEDMEMSDMQVLDEDDNEYDTNNPQQQSINIDEAASTSELKSDENVDKSEDIDDKSVDDKSDDTITGVGSEDQNSSFVNESRNVESVDEMGKDGFCESNDEGVKQTTDYDESEDSEQELKDDEVYAMLEAGMSAEEKQKNCGREVKDGETINKLILEGIFSYRNKLTFNTCCIHILHFYLPILSKPKLQGILTLSSI